MYFFQHYEKCVDPSELKYISEALDVLISEYKLTYKYHLFNEYRSVFTTRRLNEPYHKKAINVLFERHLKYNNEDLDKMGMPNWKILKQQ